MKDYMLDPPMMMEAHTVQTLILNLCFIFNLLKYFFLALTIWILLTIEHIKHCYIYE